MGPAGRWRGAAPTVLFAGVVQTGREARMDASTGTTGPALPGGRRLSRRRFLQGATAMGAAGLGTSLTSQLARAARPKATLQNIVICMQENRSFDHYYGTAPWVGSYGIP